MQLTSNKTMYRWCIVPECCNTSIKTPDKLWIIMPSDIKLRKTWLKLARRDPNSLSFKSKIYFCEDHFDLENDMENYRNYKIMGSVKKIRMRPNCLPSRFDCQQGRKRMYTSSAARHAFNIRQRQRTIRETEESINYKECGKRITSSCNQDLTDWIVPDNPETTKDSSSSEKHSQGYLEETSAWPSFTEEIVVKIEQDDEDTMSAQEADHHIVKLEIDDEGIMLPQEADLHKVKIEQEEEGIMLPQEADHHKDQEISISSARSDKSSGSSEETRKANILRSKERPKLDLDDRSEEKRIKISVTEMAKLLAKQQTATATAKASALQQIADALTRIADNFDKFVNEL